MPLCHAILQLQYACITLFPPMLGFGLPLSAGKLWDLSIAKVTASVRLIFRKLACNGEGAGPAFPSAMPGIHPIVFIIFCHSRLAEVWSVAESVPMSPSPLFLLLPTRLHVQTRLLRFRLRLCGTIPPVSQAATSLLRVSVFCLSAVECVDWDGSCGSDLVRSCVLMNLSVAVSRVSTLHCLPEIRSSASAGNSPGWESSSFWCFSRTHQNRSSVLCYCDMHVHVVWQFFARQLIVHRQAQLLSVCVDDIQMAGRKPP